jgi:hypothetical protein
MESDGRASCALAVHGLTIWIADPRIRLAPLRQSDVRSGARHGRSLTDAGPDRLAAKQRAQTTPARKDRSKHHRHWGSSIRLQALRLLLWNHAGADPIKAAEALIKLEAREARLLGLDMPTQVAITDPDGGIPLQYVRKIPGADGRGDGGRYAGTCTPAASDKSRRMIGAIGSYRLDSAKPPEKDHSRTM